MNQPLTPEMSCNNTVFKYTLPKNLLHSAKQQIQLATRGQVVMMIETPLENEQIELLVIAGSLTPSQRDELTAIASQDGFKIQIGSMQAGLQGEQASFSFLDD